MSVNFTGALEDYFNWECQSWIEILADLELDEREKFLPLDAVKTYFTTRDSKKKRNLENLLSEVFAMEFPPTNSDLMLRDHTAIFCILLRIGRGKYITYFTGHEELSDRRLPFDLAHPPRSFPNVKGDSLFLREFCNVQQRYCVPMLDAHMLHRHFGDQQLLPITLKKSLPTRGLARSHIIEIYGSYNKIIRESEKIKMPYSNIFVLRSYPTPEGLPLYARNINAFRSIRNVDGIIKFYGSFQHRQESHILLEYADKGTLSEFFETEAPPTRAADIVNFWANLLKLLKGLKAIHSLNESHQNICTDSILVLSNGTRSSSDWQFKFSKTGTSQNYESNDSKTDSQKIKFAATTDIWCLGYVFSQAALWLADGYQGILEFHKQLSDSLGIMGNKYIYEDKRLSETIIDGHAEIENNLRRSDYVTKEILTNMVDEMLWDEDRPSADVLVHRADMIISAARHKITEIFSIRNSSRRRSQSRSNQRASSLHPPIPTLANVQYSEISSLRPRLPRRAESWRTPVSKNSAPVSTCGSTVSGTGSDFSNMQTINVFPDYSTGKTTPDAESHLPVTSWFLDSPTAESFETPPTLARGSVPQFQTRTSEIKDKCIIESSQQNSRLSEPCHSTNIEQEIEKNRILDTNRPLLVNQEPGKNATFEVRLPGALQTLPSQGCQFEYRLPPLLPRNSHTKNIEAEDTKSYSVPFETPWNPLKSDDLQSSRDTQITDHKTGGENDKSHHVWSIVNNSRSSTPLKTLNASIDNSCNESATSSACNSLTNKSTRPSLGSSLLSRGRRLSSALNYRQNSILSMPDISFLTTKSALASGNFSDQVDRDQNNNKFVSLDINTCRHLKNLNKSYRRRSKISLLPGAYLLQSLRKRDHAFIVDDSVSMASHWPDVCLTFEGLTFMLKGLSPFGIELFFTISQESRRRRSIQELCNFVFDKRLQRAQTNIAKRLNLQLAAYRLKLSNSKKAMSIRPVSYYILSSGIWAPESEKALIDTLQQTATFLTQMSLKDQVFISFVGFQEDAPAACIIESLSRYDWGGGLRIKWTWWTGNVWRMLRVDLTGLDNEDATPENTDRNLTSMNMENSTNCVSDEITSEACVNKMSGIKEVEGIFELA
ncbi:putative protein kinase-like [Golovinomyces cichoracearum]|uniref:Protein kinase domain-containing protein n=1 Tax=Golovinomyces cichoracearum TaxID=62708 RepID=A0A420HKA2_9PEZI|nr:putative protein kinase-like [Golovinomyces cichoracearum]